MSDQPSRRDFFTSWFATLQKTTTRSLAKRNPEKALRPPGALGEGDFQAACTGCGDCVPVCPTSSITMIEIGEASLPAIFPSFKACYLCTELPCIKACSDGALVDPGSPERVRIGIARVDPRRCITFRGELCESCFKACPFPHQAIMMIGGRPLVGSGACTGCGLCEYACPEAPKAIRIIPERDLVPGLRVPKAEVNNG